LNETGKTKSKGQHIYPLSKRAILACPRNYPLADVIVRSDLRINCVLGAEGVLTKTGIVGAHGRAMAATVYATRLCVMAYGRVRLAVVRFAAAPRPIMMGMVMRRPRGFMGLFSAAGKSRVGAAGQPSESRQSNDERFHIYFVI
jgi:hypothetical protein